MRIAMMATEDAVAPPGPEREAMKRAHRLDWFS
jgi:hypothetical protein